MSGTVGDFWTSSSQKVLVFLSTKKEISAPISQLSDLHQNQFFASSGRTRTKSWITIRVLDQKIFVLLVSDF